MDSASIQSSAPVPTFAELFAPKLITILREGYTFADLRADVVAGLTVAIVVKTRPTATLLSSGLSH